MPLDVRFLEREVDHVASLPMIFIRINQAVDNPVSSMGDIARIIGEDSGLSTRLLRLANSAFYGFPSRIETVTHALTIIGTQQLRDLALATSVMTAFRNLPEDLIDMASFWRHSTACGVAARVLATYRRASNVERFFVGGILHDIGRLMLLQHAPDQVRPVLERYKAENQLLVNMEREALGIDHATLGGALLRTWNLPTSLVDMVTCHHHPARAGRFPEGAAVIHLADIIAHVMRLGNSGERFIPPLEPQAWEQLGFPPSLLASVMDQVEQQYASAVQIIFDTVEE